ncbi:3-oxoacyl-ACP reductase, partial [Enterobacter sp. 63]
MTQTVLVTGAAAGLGQVIAATLLEQGYHCL